MDEKQVYEIAYKTIFNRYCDALEAFDMSDMATVSAMEKASKALSDFEALATEKGFDDILIG